MSCGDKLDGIALERQVEREDSLVQFLNNSCMSCRKEFGRDEIRVLPSSYIQERDFYVRSGIVRKRLLCVDCYNGTRMATKTKSNRNRNTRRTGLRRLFSSRGFLSETLV
jgi:ribosomal protein S27AE